MSLKIIKAGVLDTVQDMGRYGYQHWGINPGGAMDSFAIQIANMLLSNDKNEAVIEMHFPAATFLFEQDAIIAIGGADFLPTINGETIPLHRPVVINKNSILQFKELKNGARSYLAVKDGLRIQPWLNSCSTNLKAVAGGFLGRPLQQDDVLHFKTQNDHTALLHGGDMRVMHWKADTTWDIFTGDSIYVLPGNELNWLKEESKKNFIADSFRITSLSDRMGYRLSGTGLQVINKQELVSSAVSFGTVQLLPDGQLIVLMADHQTTGGYPRIAHVITAHYSKLAQMQPEEKINFKFTDIKTAEDLLLKQQQHLQQLENGCKFRLEQFLNQ